MATTVKDQLFRLIESLSKAEKRHFKLYATRAGSTNSAKFIQLFDSLDRLGAPDDKVARGKLGVGEAAYANLKRHLYRQILVSLRPLHAGKEIDIELREQLDFARILYGKGHYLDALRLLERAKNKAVEHSQDLLHLEILEFQKLIEARHVTLSRKVTDKMDRLLNESAERSYSVLNTNELFNLNIQIHGRYIELGHSRTPAEREANELFWREIQTVRPDRQTQVGTFHQRINRFQSIMWYQYIQLEFIDALEAAKAAVNLFSLHPQMMVKDPDLYLRCLYYVCVFAFLTDKENRLERYVGRISNFLDRGDVRFNENSRRIGVVYRYLSSYNLLFMRKDLGGLIALNEKILEEYYKDQFRPGAHRWGMFRYKFAGVRFLAGEYARALDHLNDILNSKTAIHRDDLLINTRLLHAVCHFELGNVSLVEYNLAGLGRLLRRSNETGEVHRTVVRGLRRLIGIPVAERPAARTELLNELQRLQSQPFEAKALKYFDAVTWLQCPVEQASDWTG